MHLDREWAPFQHGSGHMLWHVGVISLLQNRQNLPIHVAVKVPFSCESFPFPANHCSIAGPPLQTISTFQACPASSVRGQMSVKQLPWWVRSKPASEPVTVSIEKCQSFASLFKTNLISCCNQVLPI